MDVVEFQSDNFLVALGVTAGASASSIIGGLICCFMDLRNDKLMSIILSSSAGVMIYVSFVEILKIASASFVEDGATAGRAFLYVHICFLCGICVPILCEKIYFESQRLKHKLHSTGSTIDELGPTDRQLDLEILSDEGNTDIVSKEASIAIYDSEMLRNGILSSLVLFLHNFPEGVVTFMAYMKGGKTGPVLAIAIAIHNLPEGVAVAATIIRGSGSKTKAMVFTVIASISEPLGAIIIWFTVGKDISSTVLGVLFAVTGGLMVYISVYKLILAAMRLDSEFKWGGSGFAIGCIIMGISLVLFESLS